MLGSAILGFCVVAVLGQVTINLPHGQQLTDLVDKGFQNLDANHDGTLQLDEFTRAFHMEDLNGDGVLTFAEFTTYMDRYGAHFIAETVFNHYDTDKDGILTEENMNQYLLQMDTNHTHCFFV